MLAIFGFHCQLLQVTVHNKPHYRRAQIAMPAIFGFHCQLLQVTVHIKPLHRQAQIAMPAIFGFHCSLLQVTVTLNHHRHNLQFIEAKGIKGLGFPPRIERFIEGQYFWRSCDSAPRPPTPPSPVSKLGPATHRKN